jgi:hypothetical protein
VVGAAKDLRHHPGVQGVAPAAYDLAVGGCAGAVAVLVSQPCDVIKTFIQCSSSSSASANLGVAGSAAAFWSTGKALVRRGGGLQVLFVGLVSRGEEEAESGVAATCCSVNGLSTGTH